MFRSWHNYNLEVEIWNLKLGRTFVCGWLTEIGWSLCHFRDLICTHVLRAATWHFIFCGACLAGRKMTLEMSPYIAHHNIIQKNLYQLRSFGWWFLTSSLILDLTSAYLKESNGSETELKKSQLVRFNGFLVMGVGANAAKRWAKSSAL